MTEIYSKKTQWRNLLFDSVLEADWASSMTVWGLDWRHHPGSLYLSDGREYQPDFLVVGGSPWSQDVLLEVKGEHDANLDKTQLIQQDNPDLMVLVGRSPYLRGDLMNEYPGAVWHRPDGQRYDWDLNGRGITYVSAEHATEKQPGLTFFKALANTRNIR